MDPAMSVGATPEAERLWSLADDMLTLLHSNAAERIAQTSGAEWLRARTHLTAGLGLLRYHRQAAQRLENNARLSRLFATRDALMAQNLLDIRSIEGRRGATLVSAHNVHLQRTPSSWSLGDLSVSWPGAGTVVAPLLGEQYLFVVGSLAAARPSGWATPSRAPTRATCRTTSPTGLSSPPARSPPAGPGRTPPRSRATSRSTRPPWPPPTRPCTSATAPPSPGRGTVGAYPPAPERPLTETGRIRRAPRSPEIRFAVDQGASRRS
ncbi:hypothetical protein GCM10017687_44880 [Streptomyces echinatus]